MDKYSFVPSLYCRPVLANAQISCVLSGCMLCLYLVVYAIKFDFEILTNLAQLYIIFMLIDKIWYVPTLVWEKLHQFSDNIWFCFVRFQSLLIFIALCFARDEVYWLLRHNDNPPQQKSKGKSAEDLVDRQLPELLFHMEELRGNSTELLLIDW